MRRMAFVAVVVLVWSSYAIAQDVVGTEKNATAAEVAELVRQVAALTRANADLSDQVKRLAATQQPPPEPEVQAAQARKTLQSTCTTLGLKMRGVTVQRTPTATVTVHCE